MEKSYQVILTLVSCVNFVLDIYSVHVYIPHPEFWLIDPLVAVLLLEGFSKEAVTRLIGNISHWHGLELSIKSVFWFKCFWIEKTGIQRLEDLQDLRESDHHELSLSFLRKLKKYILSMHTPCGDSTRGDSPLEGCHSGMIILLLHS